MDRPIRGPEYPSWKRRPAHEWDRRAYSAVVLVACVTGFSACCLIAFLVYLFTH